MFLLGGKDFHMDKSMSLQLEQFMRELLNKNGMFY